MNGKRIAIACQGGGSQCAFVAGALDEIFERRVQERHKIVGLSGTSGGALTAAMAWDGLLRQAHGERGRIGDRILSCWKDLSAQTPVEILMDGLCVQMVRLTESGLLPSVASSPSSPHFQRWSQATSRAIGRPAFTDLRALLEAHIDFGALPSLVHADSPVLLVGAGDVLEGSFKIFSSACGEINVDSLLASAAIPSLFPAVWVDGHAYWDGIFASNPPIISFLRKAMVGKAEMPEEIWIIQVNPYRHDVVPETPSDILDRRNHLSGNLSMQHELQLITMVNMLLHENALTPGFRARFGLDTTEAITVRFIRMSPELQKGLDYPSKLSRLPSHIEALIADGRSQAGAFLTALEAPEPPPPEVTPDGRGDGAERMYAGRPV